MKYDLYELLGVAILTNTPFVLVEGKDDPQIYERIAKKANKQIDIYPINTIEEYASGCDNVIDALNILQPKFDEREDNENKILGIIDRDVRPYRNLEPDEIDYRILKGLFVLKYYSIETYFATKNNLKKVIKKLTYATQDILTDEIIMKVEEGFNYIHNELYLISLEALKNACITDYSSIVSYDDDNIKEEGRRKYLYDRLKSKEQDLNIFVNEKNRHFPPFI